MYGDTREVAFLLKNKIETLKAGEACPGSQLSTFPGKTVPPTIGIFL